MKKLFLLLFLGMFSLATEAQLVNNGDFQLYNNCPQTYVGPPGPQVFEAQNWQIPSGHHGTSDHFHSCAPSPLTGSVNVPGNSWGYQLGRNGKNSYLGLGFNTNPNPSTSYVEYAQTQLTSPLVGGETYQATMYVSLADKAEYAVAGISMLFTQTAVTNSGVQSYITGHEIGSGVEPQVMEMSVIHDRTNWVKVTGQFVASGGEEWLTIGLFDAPTSAITPSPGGTPGFSNAFYYVQDVQVASCKNAPLPISIPFGKVGCDQPVVLLPGAHDPDISYSPFPGLPAAAISANGEFIPGEAGPGIWNVYQTVTTPGGCEVTNVVTIEVVQAEGAIMRQIGPFCEGDEIYYTIPGGGDLVVTQSPIHDMIPFPIYSPVISGLMGFTSQNSGFWEIRQTITTPGGCEMIYFYQFEVIDCECLIEFDFTATESQEACYIYDILASINLNGLIPIHFKWTVGNTNYQQTIVDEWYASPALNQSFDFSELPAQIWGQQELCFEIWCAQPGSEEIVSYCKFCESLDLCIPNDQRLATEWIEEQESQGGIMVVPNPSSGLFQITGFKTDQPVHVEVFDLMGRSILEQNQVSSNAIEIDIQSQPTGIYLIRFQQGDQVEVQKVVKR